MIKKSHSKICIKELRKIGMEVAIGSDQAEETCLGIGYGANGATTTQCGSACNETEAYVFWFAERYLRLSVTTIQRSDKHACSSEW